MNWANLVARNLDPVWREYNRLDPWEQAQLADEINEGLLAAQKELARLRRVAVRELRAQGHTLAEIANEIGISATRVHQIEQGYGRAERRDRKAQHDS